jgi:hypothetical protein
VTTRNLLAVVLDAREDLASLKLRVKDRRPPQLKSLSNNKSLGMITDNQESLEHPGKTTTKIIRVTTPELAEEAAVDTLVEVNRTKATEEATLTETITVLKTMSRRMATRTSLVVREEAEATVEMVSAEEAVATEVENLIQTKNQRSLKNKNDMLPYIHKRV